MTPLRLSAFIRDHMEPILQAWENFARTVEPPAIVMDDVELRDHAQLMLMAIADDLDNSQSDDERCLKSEGRGPATPGDTAAEKHAEARLLSGYTAVQLVSEYRALRASVLWLWGKKRTAIQETDIEDMTRFNEGIDQALAESVARYEKLVNESRDMFLAILGHDLRNPLGTLVAGSTNIMRSEDVPPKHIVTAARMYRSAHRMRSLVDDLVEFTRTHLGPGIPVQLKEVDVVQICTEIVDELRIAHPERPIILQGPISLAAVVDSARVGQMISNLLGNAIQYGDAGTPIILTVQSDSEAVTMEFCNQGKPIPADKISSIFDPLIRVESEKAVSGGSLGIGLFIARETVLAHGGKINVSSNAQDGTKFQVVLPLTPQSV